MGQLAARSAQDSTLESAFVAELHRAVRSSEWNSRAHLWLGLLSLGKQDAAVALDHFAEVERLAPITPGLAFRQGIAHEMLGQSVEAQAAYRRALQDTTDAEAARAALNRIGR